MKRVIYIGCSLFFLGCMNVSGKTAHNQVSKITKFNTLSMNKVLDELGFPERCDTFLIQEIVGEFRIELLNTYPLTNPKNRKVKIKELHWKDGDYNITLWFHQIDGNWVVLDGRRWHKNVDF